MPDLVNNFTAIDPVTGEATGVFPGGIRILAGDNATPPDARQIQWVKQSDGSVVARFLTYNQPNFSQMNMSVQGDAPAGVAFSQWFAQGGDNVASAEINLECTPNPGGLSEVTVQAVRDASHSHQVTVLDDSGKSDFLQLADPTGFPTRRQIETGRVSVPWIGGSKISSLVTVFHDLGVTPNGVWFMGAEQGTSSNFMAFVIKDRTASQFDFWAYNIDQTPGAAFNSAVAWIAFG